MASFLEQLRQTTGVDVAKVVGSLAPGESISNGSFPSSQDRVNS
jgi:flotillin